MAEESVLYGKNLKIIDGDLVLAPNRRLEMIEGTNNLEQALEILLKTIYGEDFLQPEYGFDRKRIVGEYNPLDIKFELIRTLLTEPRITEVDEVDVGIPDRFRKIDITAKVTGTGSEELTIVEVI